MATLPEWSLLYFKSNMKNGNGAGDHCTDISVLLDDEFDPSRSRHTGGSFGMGRAPELGTGGPGWLVG